MVRRILLMVVPLLAALAGALPLRAQQPAPARIVAVGDLHGDYGAWIDIARDARLIDAANKWIGGRTVLVQTGDITDRGADSLKIIRHLQQLDGEAKRAGGRVIVLLGNHEAMQVTGDLRYVSAGEFAAFADRQSSARRDAAYEANVKAIIDFYHQRDPSLSPKAIRAMWMADHPLGKIEHAIAWAPIGRARALGGDPAGGRQGRRHLVRRTAGSAPNIRWSRWSRSIAEHGLRSRRATPVPRRSSTIEMGPLWYRGLITAGGRGRGPRRGASDDRKRAGRRAEGPRGQADRDRPYSPARGCGDHSRRRPGPDRYRNLAILWRDARLARDPRRQIGCPHSDKERQMKLMVALVLAVLALGTRAAAAPAEPAKPLFATDEVIRLTLRGAIDSLSKGGPDSRATIPAVLSVAGTADTLPVQLSLRGITRRKRDICQFPPLRVDVQPDPAGDVFVRRAAQVEAGHALPPGAGLPAICADGICHLPAVQPADSAQHPGAVGADRLCR